MENDNLDDPEVLETAGETAGEEEGADGESQKDPLISAEELDALRAKAAKADELEAKNKQLYERAKKAKDQAKEATDGLTSRDTLSLGRANIADEDVDEVIDFAKFKKISVAEALKHPSLKAILTDRVEVRRTAAATQTRGGQRGAAQTSPDVLLHKARTGELPKEEDIDKLVEAEMQARLKK